MRRTFMCPLMFAAALIGLATAGPTLAQERTAPGVNVVRATPDLGVLERRLRDRGVSEDRIGISIARIRAAIASGNYPHLERRIYNWLNPGDGGDANRRRVLRDDNRRVEAVAPAAATGRTRAAAAPAVARRQ